MRRLSAILCVAGLVVALGMAVVGQFQVFGLVAPKNEVFMVPEGVWIEHNAARGWEAYHYRVMLPWKASNLLKAPSYEPVLHGTGIFFPWWLLLAGWGLVLWLAWRRTRSQNAKIGFSIEPPARADGLKSYRI